MLARVTLSDDGTTLTEFIYEASPDEVNDDTGTPVFSDMTSDEIAQEMSDRAREQARCLYPEHSVVAVELEDIVSTPTEYEKAYRAAWRAAGAAITEAMRNTEAEALERVAGNDYSPHAAGDHAVEDIYKCICDRYGIGGNVEAEVREAVREAIRDRED
jgi:hypothetical protein